MHKLSAKIYILLLLGLEAWSMAVSKLYCLSRRCLSRSRRFTCLVNWLIQYWICESNRRLSCFKSPTLFSCNLCLRLAWFSLDLHLVLLLRQRCGPFIDDRWLQKTLPWQHSWPTAGSEVVEYSVKQSESCKEKEAIFFWLRYGKSLWKEFCVLGKGVKLNKKLCRPGSF